MPLCKKLIIEGRLWGLNDHLNACKSKYGQAISARYKRETEEMIGLYIKKHLGNWHTDKMIYIKYKWFEPNMKRDLDNVAYAKKFVQDSLVKHGVIKNDGWRNILGFSDDFGVDAEHPRVEVEIIEMD